MKALLFAVALFLTACAGMAPVRDVGDALLYAQGQVTATRAACLDAAEHKELERDDVRVCIDSTDRARAAIEAALVATDIAEQERGLATALAILETAQALLRSK